MQKRRNVPVGGSDEKEEKSQVYLNFSIFISRFLCIRTQENYYQYPVISGYHSFWYKYSTQVEVQVSSDTQLFDSHTYISFCIFSLLILLLLLM